MAHIVADEIYPGEVISTLLVRHPDRATVEVLVGFEPADGEEARARFTVPASVGVRTGDPVRVVRRPDGALRLAQSERPARPPTRWWPPPDLRTGAWGLVALVIAAVLVAAIAWAAVGQRTGQLPTGPPTATPSSGAPAGAPGAAAGSTGPNPTVSSTSEAPYEPGQ